MGNRAVIATESKDLGVYLHWNGGRDSVEAFLAYCDLQGYSSPESDDYGWARLCQTIGNFFGGSTSLGIDKYELLDTNNYDNGVYIIKNWKIVDRLFHNRAEQQEYNLGEMLIDINDSQPEKLKLDENVIEKYIESLENKKVF